ncbi:MAG: prohibitin family protein [Clostridia bacterium]|nr:prohibitin family protein [Clostridia bacterium]
MAWVILTLIAVVAAWILLGITKTGWRRNAKQWASLLCLVFIAFGVITSVPTGHTGILTTFGKVEDVTLEAGVQFKLPWQEIVCMDNRTQKGVVEMKGFSKDIQEVSIIYSINYQINKQNAQNIYKSIGTDYYDRVMSPRIQETVKNVIANYDAEQLINSRDTLSQEITALLKEELSFYNIDVVSTAIEDLDFSDAFTNAVEEKAVAAQALLKAKTEQEQKTMEEEQKAARQKIQAEANATVAKIEAEADREVLQIQADAAEYAGQKDAAVNEALAKSLTDILIEYYKIQQWDGKLPETYLGGDGSTVLPIIGSLPTEEETTEVTAE